MFLHVIAFGSLLGNAYQHETLAQFEQPPSMSACSLLIVRISAQDLSVRAALPYTAITRTDCTLPSSACKLLVTTRAACAAVVPCLSNCCSIFTAPKLGYKSSGLHCIAHLVTHMQMLLCALHTAFYSLVPSSHLISSTFPRLLPLIVLP